MREIQAALDDQEVAMAKLPMVIEHLREIVDGNGKCVVFAHHLDVIGALMREFGSKAVKVDGSVSIEDRQAAVDRFQTDESCRLFVGGIHAAGVGLTLTASSLVVFAELDWVPGNLSQAEDRCHRIGQHDSVLVQHLVLEGSIDSRMVRTLIAKQEVIDACLDGHVTHEAQEPVLPVDCVTITKAEVDKIAKEAESGRGWPAERIAATHEGLKMLAGVCNGAATCDDMGFSKVDVGIGHSLARCGRLSPKQAALGARLVNKYRRQLPDGLVAVATGKEDVQ